MIDLHCHLIPEIDDGAKTLDVSLQMARHAVKSGIKRIIATPHITPGRYDNNLDTIRLAFEQLKQTLVEQNIPLELGFAAEIRFDSIIMDMVNSETLPILGRYQGDPVILLEFPHTHIPPGSEELIDWLAKKSIRVMIAHPERNQSVLGDIDKIKDLLKKDCLLQITGGSLTGVFNDKPRDCALELLKRNWVTVIASDAHNMHARCPELEPGKQVAADIVGEEEASRMVMNRPKDISDYHFI